MTDKYAELVRQLHHEERYALRQGYLHIADVLCKSATAITELQARVRDLEEVGSMNDRTGSQPTFDVNDLRKSIEAAERARNALREAQEDE